MSLSEKDQAKKDLEIAEQNKHTRKIETIRTIFGCILFPAMVYIDATIKPVPAWQWVLGLVIGGVKPEHMIKLLDYASKITSAVKTIGKDDQNNNI